MVTLAEEGKINPTEASYLKQILELTQAIKNSADLNVALLVIENEVFNNMELSNGEKTLIGIASSIAAASASYWSRQLINSPWKSVIEPDFGVDNLFRINWADAIGGAVGCISCAAAGGGVTGCIGCGTQLGGFASKLFAKS